ncbi:MAG: DUF3489 domain-containing protein [Alphaproteobacteria bacterium]|nr:DUF3489 domain-containing protein [Alphaproteobacteria bacterium]
MLNLTNERTYKMTTQKNKTKSNDVITFEDLGNKLTQTLNEITSLDTDIKNTSKQFKTAMMAVMLTKEEGVSIKELADKLGWKENSVRGAMSVLASKQVGATLTSEKKDGVRRYRLIAVAPEVDETPETIQ